MHALGNLSVIYNYGYKINANYLNNICFKRKNNCFKQNKRNF